MTYVFDIRARVYCDNIAMLDAQIMSYDPVDTGASIIEIVVGKNDENGILPLLSLHHDSVATEETKGFHGVVGQGNNRVVIVGSIGDAMRL